MSTEYCEKLGCVLVEHGCAAEPEGVYKINISDSIDCRHGTCPTGMRRGRTKLRTWCKIPRIVKTTDGRLRVGYPFGTEDHKPENECGRLVMRSGQIITLSFDRRRRYLSPQNVMTRVPSIRTPR